MSALGDVAMTIPVIYSFARQYPNMHVSVLTRPFFAKLFINAPYNIEIICFPSQKRYNKVVELWNLLFLLMRKRFCYVADLHNVLRSWIICFFLMATGSKVKMIDKGRIKRPKFLREKQQQRNFILRYCDVFHKLGVPVVINFNSVFTVEPQLPQEFKLRKPAIGIAPTARYANKTYPIEHTREVINKLIKDGFNVYIFGARSEIETLNWISNGKAVVVAGQYDIQQELAIMYHLDLMLTMDSANQHLAAMVGTKVLTIWGSTTPECGFSPFKSKTENALLSRCVCQPCTIAGSDTCKSGTLECMMTIMPDYIVNKIKLEMDEE